MSKAHHINKIHKWSRTHSHNGKSHSEGEADVVSVSGGAWEQVRVHVLWCDWGNSLFHKLKPKGTEKKKQEHKEQMDLGNVFLFLIGFYLEHFEEMLHWQYEEFMRYSI